VPHVLVTLRLQTLWHRMNWFWTITNLCFSTKRCNTNIYRNSFFVRTSGVPMIEYNR
jgi:hypothetical protein